MYFSQHVPARSLLVARFACGGDEEADFLLHLERMAQGCEAGRSRGKRLAVLIFPDPGHEIPSAKVRRQLAQLRHDPSFNPIIAIVSAHPVIRSVLMAIEWLGSSNWEIRNKATVSEAIAWLEEMRGEKFEISPILPDVLGS